MVTPVLAALAMLLTPAGGYHGHYVHGRAAHFEVGAAVKNFTPPLFGKAPGGDPANCSHPANYNGPRQFAFEEPYVDVGDVGHYAAGDPYIDCNHNGRWDGNLLGGGGNSPRFYDHVADQVGARAMVVSNGHRKIAVEVVDQEGLFDIYQQRIRAKVRADGYRLNNIFISATHDESAPDTMGLGGISETTSGVNAYWAKYLVDQGALAIEQADRKLRSATIRYTEVLEPSNVRQCWSSYPFVDDQHIPVLQAVGPRGRTIVTLASVSQHDETLGFNGGTPTLDAQNNWVSSDWVHFFRERLQQRLGGVAIEMAGSVGSNESPEVYPFPISRIPSSFIDASHPAGCRTLFNTRKGPDVAGTYHVPVGYHGETQAFGQDIARPIVGALKSGEYHNSSSNTLWGTRANICVKLQNALFELGAAVGVFGGRPAYNQNCTKASPVASDGATGGASLRSQVAVFQIGDGEFLSLPGEVFPFTFLRSFLGPQDMPHSGPALPPWLIPYMKTPYRFIDGLGEDMLGYIFPAGNATGIPTASNMDPSGNDRFNCHHSDDSEATSAQTANIIGRAEVRLLKRHSGKPEPIANGRYILPSGKLSRDPLGGPESIECTTDTVFHATGHAVGVELADGKVVHPKLWMSLSGLPQRVPDRDTRGYFSSRGERVWLNVYPSVR